MKGSILYFTILSFPNEEIVYLVSAKDPQEAIKIICNEEELNYSDIFVRGAIIESMDVVGIDNANRTGVIKKVCLESA